MKRLWILLALCLLLAGCTAISANEEQLPMPTQETEPVVVHTEPEPTEPPDAGIAEVVMEAPAALTVTPQAPDAVFSVRFTNVDPTGAPERGRPCTLTLYKDGETWAEGSLLLQEDAEEQFCVSYEFTRYMEQTSSELTLTLTYLDQTIGTTVAVTLENAPDEVYAAQSGDALPYRIDVIRNQNVVIVYGKDDAGNYAVPVHVYLCSTGNGTPSGSYWLGGRSEWQALFHGVFGQYAIGIWGDILFHSVPYSWIDKDTLLTEEYNKLGTTASMGCVRMAVADVKWLYDYCPVGTPIRIYDAEELPAGIEKPELDPIDPDDPRAGWDPTDPDANNPWLAADET